MKKKVVVFLFGLVLLITGLIGIREFSYQFWKATLSGPFTGIEYSDSITNNPTSVITISSHGHLEVYELASYTNPIVALRLSDGRIQWARLLLPERKLENGVIEHAAVREFKFLNFKQRSEDPVVLVSCVWDWGGEEHGLIELEDDYEFKSFSLSW